ncbi:DMT family transporter [uncultured Enterovirga sp.]|uniref:DMT family transporter n=1 Tax=uncultured Enterovirga sp. TaxID=2026352 RepID=UPI0035C9DF58
MNPLAGIALKTLSALAFTFMSAGIKWLAEAYPTGQIVFFRSAFALVPLCLWLSWQGGVIASVRTSDLRGHILRGFISTAGMAAGFLALAYLPLSDAIAVGYASPLITVALAALVLGEVVRIYRWSAVALGFVGVLTMLYPSLGAGLSAGGSLGGGTAIGAAAALFAACCSAAATIQVRRLTKTERTGAIVLYFTLISTALGLVTLAFGWRMPGGADLAILVAVGILGGIGQILLTQSFRFADASVIAPFDYTTMIWALPIGWLLFDQLPDRYVLTGGLIVAGAGLFVIWRERRLGLVRARHVETGAQKSV